MYTLEFNVTDKLSKIIKFLNEIDFDEMRKYHEYRLVYPMGTLKTLDLDKSFYELSLPSEAKLVLMGTKTLTWDPIKRGSQIQVRRSIVNLLALK